MALQLLYADDSATMHRVVQITFAREDVQITGVYSGQQATTKSLEQPVHLALIDLSLPDQDGYAVCQAIKSNPQTAHIPVLLLSSTQEAYDENKGHAAGAQGHIVKPFDTQTLIDQVKRLSTTSQPAGMSAPTVQEAVASVAPPTPHVTSEPVSSPAPPPEPWIPAATPAPTLRATVPPTPPAALPEEQKPQPIAFHQAPPKSTAAPAPSASATAAQLTSELSSSFEQLAPIAAEQVKQAVPQQSQELDTATLLASAREILERVAWEVVPPMAEALIKAHIEQLAKR